MSLMEGPKRSRRKLYWGCGGAMLSFIGVLAIAMIFVNRHMMAAMPLVAPETFVTPDAAAVLVMRIDPDDALMAEIPARLTGTDAAARILAPGSEATPQPLDAGRLRQDCAPLQLVATWSFNFLEDRPHAGLAIQLGKGGRAFGSQIARHYGQSGGTPLDHEGVPIWPGRTTYTAFSENAFMITTALPLSKAWAGRFRQAWAAGESSLPAPPEQGASEQVQACLDRLDPGAPLRFAAVNEGGQMTLLLARLAAATPEDRRAAVENAFVEAKCIAAQITGRDATSGSLTLHVMAPAASAPALEETLEGAGMASVQVQAQEGGWLRCTAIIPEMPERAAALVTALAQAPAPVATPVAVPDPGQ